MTMQFKIVTVDPKLDDSHWLNTNLTVTQGERLTIVATGRINLWPRTSAHPEYETYWRTPEGGLPGAGDYDAVSPVASLVGKIGLSGTVFKVGSFYDDFAPQTGTVYLRVNDLTGATQDNRGYFLAWGIVGAPGKPNHNAPCPYGNDQKVRTENPIELDDGNKVLSFVDLGVETPVGRLSFEREYNQSRRNHPRYQFMGMGWSHNHAYKLYINGTNAEVYLPNGGILQLEDLTASGDQFSPLPGSTSVLDRSGNNYILTTQDKSQFTFEPYELYEDGLLYRMLSRRLPNGVSWNYSYEDSAAAQPIQVSDDYNNLLQFSYVNSADYDNGQLWRVGDKTATGLDDLFVEGRFIEFTYTPEKSGGNRIPEAKALLKSFHDVRSNDWDYDYFGQHSWETSPTSKLNLMTKRWSPYLDATDYSPSRDEIELEDLSYDLNDTTISKIYQKRGQDLQENYLLDTEYSFQDGGQNRTRETPRAGGNSISSLVKSHYLANGAYLASSHELDALDLTSIQITDDTYRPVAKFDGRGNETKLDWELNGKRLTKVTNVRYGASNIETLFEYNDGTDTLKLTTDPEQRKTLYVYDPERRQPTVIVVADSAAEIAIDGAMEEFSGWYEVGDLSVHTLETTLVDSGTYSRHIVTPGDGAGIERTSLNLQAGYTYLVSARVFPGAGRVKAQLVNSSDEMLASTLSNDQPLQLGKWQTLRLLYTPTTSMSDAKLQFLSDGNAADFYVDSVHLVEAMNIQRWQEVIYDDRERVLFDRNIDPTNAGLRQEIERTYVTSGDGEGMVESVYHRDLVDTANTNWTTFTYDTAGRVVKTTKENLFDSCQSSFNLYDYAGNVLASICNYKPYGSPDPTTVDDAISFYDESHPDENRVTVHEYDELGRQIAVTTNAGSETNKQTNLTFYDELDRVVRTITNYIPQGTGKPADWYWSSTTQSWQRGSGDPTPIDSGVNNDQNIISQTEYNERGLVCRTIDALGNVVLYGYDIAGRVVKTVQNASRPAYNNKYGGANADPSLSLYGSSTYPLSVAPDQDIVTEMAYDSTGNLVKTVDPLNNVTFTVYDDLNRPTKVVRNAKDAARVDLYDNDPLYNAGNDPASPTYSPVMEVDRDLIETTEYDSMGRVIRQTDVLGNVTYMVYDTHGRVAKTIRNYVVQGISDPKDWYWYEDETTQRWQRSSSDPTPIDHGVTNDRNIVTLTAYDSEGRVMYTQDILGRRIWNKYDSFGRVVKTIVNAVGRDTTGSSNDPRSDSYVPSTDSDKDRISVTTYDTGGRVQWTQDPNRRKTWYVYDDLGRVIKTIVNCSYVSGSPEPADPTYTGSGNPDEDRITLTYYDALGRTQKTIDPAGVETQYRYDVLGRRIKTIINYVAQANDPANWIWNAVNNQWEDGNGIAINHGAEFDQNLVSETIYNRAGQVIATRDARGTQTTFTYDRAGRQLVVNQVADTMLQRTSYTCYDKAGRVQRVIQNWIPVYDGSGELISPDERDGSGNWVFAPQHHGQNNDRDLITTFDYDLASRRMQVTDPMGNATTTTYFKDGQLQSITDPEEMVTQYRYDGLRRRTRVVQGYIVQGSSDPQDWTWDAVDGRWEYPTNNPVAHGTNNDQNIIVDVTYDKVGRVLSQRDPRGNVTTYQYDQLDRRQSLTNPISKIWSTAYTDLADGKTRVTMTYPGITGASNYQVQRGFDQLGRLASIQYGDPADTPDVTFTYDAAGNRRQMIESNGVSTIRQTELDYDALHRLTSAEFDNNGDGTDVKTVNYEYDAGGLRTKLTMPDNLSLTYTYDQRGQLVSLTDWDGQHTQLSYDQAGRHIATQRSNGLCSRYEYDAAGRLQHLRHHERNKTLGRFVYQVDGRGNRKQVFEQLGAPAMVVATLDKANAAVEYYQGVWSDSNDFKITTQFEAAMRVTFTGNEARLTLGTGPDHSIFDIYIDGSLWESFDGYSGAAGERSITLYLNEGGAHVVNIRNRPERNAGNVTEPPVYKVSFKQLEVLETIYTQLTIQYEYDAVSRLLEAQYYLDAVTDMPRYQYTYDRVGNRLSETLALNGSILMDTNYSYNAVNQMIDDGVYDYQYDANGNLWRMLEGEAPNQIVLQEYQWDRANRLTSVGDTAYVYDGLGNRVQQTVETDVTRYLLDLQPGLAVVLAATKAADTTRYVHSPRGIHAQKDPQNEWAWMVQDGLGSVRGILGNAMDVLESRLYSPYGVPLAGPVTTDPTYNPPVYGFTGEPVDANGLLYLRARYYSPNLGVFTSQDPFEGMADRPMSLNGYLYVEGNTPNATDPSGKFTQFIDGITLANILNGGICSLGEIFPVFSVGGGGDILLAAVMEQKDRICNTLCPSLTSPNYLGLKEDCKDRLKTTICALLCGGDDGRKVMNEAYKGVFQRWIEYRENSLKLDKLGRANHQDTYERVRNQFSKDYGRWWQDCRPPYTGEVPQELRDFDSIAQQWKGQALKSVIPEETSGLYCLSPGVCLLRLCDASGNCTNISLPQIILIG